MKKSYLILLFSIVIIGCNETKDIKPTLIKRDIVKEDAMMVGGSCSYKDYMSKVKIVSIEESGTHSCQKSVTIKYTFIEKAEGLPISPIGEVKYPLSKAFLITEGFAIGTVHSLKTSTIKSGSCTPFIEEINGVDVSKFRKECR